MQTNKLPYEKIVFVCTNKRPAGERISCAARGAGELCDKLKSMVAARQLQPRVRICTSGCMDRCENGPNIMIFPDNVWLSDVREEDVESIFDSIVASLRTEESAAIESA